jgi:DNA-binding SARP family transcriptional activator/tetratricopeptide (TPR) repeat protein
MRMGEASAPLEIQLFGTPRVALAGRSVDGMRRKIRALVFFLAANKQPVSRDQLLTFFWPDHERGAAQPILRTMIHDLRKHLGGKLQADDQGLSLAADTIVDAHVFSAAVNSSTKDIQVLAKALALYEGDFLEGFSLTDSPQFEDWTASERERYRLIATRGYARLAGLHEELHDYPVAVQGMRKALAFNPYQEDLQREVMRLLYLSGDRAGVIRQYEGLRKLLDEEMGVPPMPETRRLYDAIITEEYPGPAAESGASTLTVRSPAGEEALPFVGRGAELHRLASELDSGKLILVEGEAGIGKTRLVSELIAAQFQMSRSALLVKGAAYELEQGLPYEPILDAIRGLMVRPDWQTLFGHMQLAPAWSTELARLLPELPTQFRDIALPDQPADEAHIWEALHQFFLALSRSHKVWLILDDLHWADAATIGWLGYLIRHLSTPRLVLLVTARPAEEPTVLTKLLQVLERSNRLVRFQLPALTPSAMEDMAAALSPGQDERLSDWLIKNAEGNPFFLAELVRYARGIGLLRADGSLDEGLFSSSPAIPATIQNLVESRLLRLSENARHVLHLAAVVGREFNLELLERASSLAESEVLDAIEELQSAHLIQSLRDENFAFDHSLTMQVALQDLSQARKRSLHRSIAEALESLYKLELDSMSGLIARHFIDGNLPARAAPHAFHAGNSASKLAAWVEAIAFFEQALAFETDDVQRARILVAVGDAHFHKGDFALASRDYQAAVGLAEMSRGLPLLEEAEIGLNLSLIPQGRFAEAIQEAKRLRESGPAELAPCAEFVWGASLTVESAHPLEAERHLRESARLLQERPDYSGKVASAQIKYSLAAVFGQQGRSPEAVGHYREVLEMLARGEGTLDTLRHIMLYNNLAYHLHLLGDPLAAATVQKGIELAKERGSLSHLPYLYSTSGEIALAAGDLDTAEKYFREGLALAEQVPIRERIAGMTANLGLVAKQRGDPGRARDQLHAALDLAELLGNHHLEVRIRLWLAPLLSSPDDRICLQSARKIAEEDGLQGLLEEIDALEKHITRSP